MTPAARAAAYFRQKPGAMSPRQQRRYRQKVFRGLLNSVAGAGGVPATDCAPRAEGHPAHAPTVAEPSASSATVGASPQEVAE